MRKIPKAATDQNNTRKISLKRLLEQGQIPTPPSLADAIQHLFITDAVEVLRHHRGFALEDKLRSLRTTLTLFERAYTDLTQALAHFDEFSRTPEFHGRAYRRRLDEIESSIRKEIFLLSTLAHSVQDHCYLVREYWDSSETSGKIKQHFGDDGLHNFICRLRNAMHHQSMVEADWLIHGSGAEATSHYMFEKEELQLLSSGTWTAPAKSFLEKACKRIDVASLFTTYVSRIRAFYDWFLPEVEKTLPEEVRDYRQLLQSHRALASRQTWRLLLGIFLERKIDPYPHLPKYLAEDELAFVNGLTTHSREQVDEIIRVLDEHGACDSETRTMVYRLFAVV